MIRSLTCFAAPSAAARPAHLVAAAAWSGWLAAQPEARRTWIATSGFKAKPGSATLLPGADGGAEAAVVLSDPPSPWDIAELRAIATSGTWRLIGDVDPADAALGWALAAYRFERYKTESNAAPSLALPDTAAVERARILAESFYLARDLINLPANDLGPEELAGVVEEVGAEQGAAVRVVAGDALLAAGYPLVHVVGQASARAPRLADLRWGDPDAPRLTLVGKGVCFDSGGLDLKPASGMAAMKKDMGGAALMLALARAVMRLGLPLRLRLLVPAVENAIGGRAFRPGDIVRSRKGVSVEIGNTDAEGRLILADALADADAERPALLLDAATLTGAARVALGPEIPALFTPDDALASELLGHAERLQDPVWRLPLYPAYRRWLDSPVADLNNVSTKPLAGAIIAALFLKEFVTETRAWAHLDIYAMNDEARAGRPRGGEASALRPLLALVESRFGGPRP